MPAHTDPEGFGRAYRAGDPFFAWAKMPGDLLTPVAAFLRLRAGAAGPAFLLESVEGGAVRGRYSIIGIEPDLVWRCISGRAEIDRDAGSGRPSFVPVAKTPLASLRALAAESRVASEDGLPPMAAGLFGYLGYDMVREMERLGPAKPHPVGAPDAVLVRPTAVLVFDAVRDDVWIVRVVRPGREQDADATFAQCRSAIDRVMELLETPLPCDLHDPPAAGFDPAQLVSNTSPEAYEAAVLRAKEYILSGDIFQVVLSQRFEAPFPLPPFSLYRALRRTNPAPFLCYLDFEAFQIVCSSPEILVRVRDGRVTVRPIAGTRRRGATPAEDESLAEELLGNDKERAEHLMLLDLGRNDVGRVAEIGSVSVTDSFFIERYSQVMHIVSNVEGGLRHDRDALDALVAGFPAGTVSGAPKVRAMQIIDELEPEGRGAYAGAIGYFGSDGQMDSCIVLRTAIVQDGRMYVQAGAGIVHDSDPAAEGRECADKARALFRAAEEAIRLAAEPRRSRPGSAQ